MTTDDEAARIGAADIGDALAFCSVYGCKCDAVIEEPLSDAADLTLQWWLHAPWMQRGDA